MKKKTKSKVSQLVEVRTKIVLGIMLVAAYMVANPNTMLELTGHTDWLGHVDYNERLSKNRCMAAYNYLKDKGIAEGRMRPDWHGDGPAGFRRAAGWRRARRAERSALSCVCLERNWASNGVETWSRCVSDEISSGSASKKLDANL